MLYEIRRRWCKQTKFRKRWIELYMDEERTNMVHLMLKSEQVKCEWLPRCDFRAKSEYLSVVLERALTWLKSMDGGEQLKG